MWVRVGDARRVAVAGALVLLLVTAACSSSNNNNSKNAAATIAAPAATSASTVAAAPATAIASPSVRLGTPAGATPARSAAATGTPGGAAASIPTVTITTKDFSFDAPDSIQAGLTRLRMQNSGKEDHQAQLLRLNQGVTLPQLQAALQQSPDKALALVSATGGPNVAPPGSTTEVVQDLQPGQYVFVCFVSGADDVPHLAKGMIKPVQVTGTSSGQAQLPAAQANVTMKEFSFDVPATVPAGQTTLKGTNNGTQPHEMTVVKLNGITADQLKAALSNSNATPPPGPPPFDSVGGLGGIAPGTSGETTLNLTAGNYALICFIPDPASGKAHAELGMVNGFSVK